MRRILQAMAEQGSKVGLDFVLVQRTAIGDWIMSVER
jgi:hypothetical protein